MWQPAKIFKLNRLQMELCRRQMINEKCVPLVRNGGWRNTVQTRNSCFRVYQYITCIYVLLFSFR